MTRRECQARAGDPWLPRAAGSRGTREHAQDKRPVSGSRRAALLSNKKRLTELTLKFKQPTAGTDWCGKGWMARPEVWVSCGVGPSPGLCAHGAALASP